MENSYTWFLHRQDILLQIPIIIAAKAWAMHQKLHKTLSLIG